MQAHVPSSETLRINGLIGAESVSPADGIWSYGTYRLIDDFVEGSPELAEAEEHYRDRAETFRLEHVKLLEMGAGGYYAEQQAALAQTIAGSEVNAPTYEEALAYYDREARRDPLRERIQILSMPLGEASINVNLTEGDKRLTVYVSGESYGFGLDVPAVFQDIRENEDYLLDLLLDNPDFIEGAIEDNPNLGREAEGVLATAIGIFQAE